MGCTSGCQSGGGCSSGGCSSGGCASGGCQSCPLVHAYDWLADVQPMGEEVEEVEVVFKGGRKGFYRNTKQLDIQTGDYVIVEADRGIDFGTIHLMGELVRLRMDAKNLEQNSFPKVVRKVTTQDIQRWERNKSEEAEAFLVGRKIVDRMNLPMKIADVEWQFDHKKVTFYFTADRRIDFRQLVRKMAGEFRTRVELRQIGVRDEAARLGGIGSCGRELCCSTWLQEFKPVTTQAAKVQDLPLNPVRLSGQCGRLKCCLNYELEFYMKALKAFPRIGQKIETPTGNAQVQKMDIFRQTVLLKFEEGQRESRSLDEVNEYILAAKQSHKPKPASPPSGL